LALNGNKQAKINAGLRVLPSLALMAHHDPQNYIADSNLNLSQF
jgi:hypothetical protein